MKFHCERICNYGASIPERIRAYPSVSEVSNTLEHARKETSAVAAKLHVRSQRSFKYARSEASSTFAVKLCSRSEASSTLVVKLFLCGEAASALAAKSSSTLAVKLCCRSEDSSTLATPGEYSKPRPHLVLCCDYCRRYRPIRVGPYTRSFSLFKQVDGPS